jgi:hypothetical protein
VSLSAEVETQQAAAVKPKPKPLPIAKAYGVDISSWNHPEGKAIDWHAVKAGGYSFVMIKASQGHNYVNPYFAEDCHAAHEAGLIVGAYHFYEDGAPVAEQAQCFISATMGHVLELGSWIDWEPGAMADYKVQSEYDGLKNAIAEARPGVGLYCDESWYSTFERLGLVINRLWLGEWSGITITKGVTVIQLPTAAVEGIDGQVDIDILTTTRPIPLPKPTPKVPIAVAVPPKESPAEVAGETAAADEMQRLATSEVPPPK